MKQKQISKFQMLFLKFRQKKTFHILFVSIIIPLIYGLVYLTGGSKFVYSHTMYVPIVYAGLLIGSRFGIVAGLVGGILLGPLMPLDTATGEAQEFFNWLYRLLMFTISGALAGMTSDTLYQNIDTHISLLSHNHDTNIPNANFLSTINQRKYDPNPQTVITIIVNNYENIQNILGSDIYYKIIRNLHAHLKIELPEERIIVQPDSNKLWVAIPTVNLEEDVNNIVRLLNEPLNIDSVPVYVEFNLGATTAKNQQECLKADTYKHSDLAARYARIHNLPYAIYDEKHNYNRYDYELLSSFHEALSENQTFLVYQPKIDLKTGKPIGLEALIRWNHPRRGLIMPDSFIPLVEETQLIHQLTEWVLHKVISKIKEFQAEDIDAHISINISVKDLFDDHFINSIVESVRQAGISPKQLEFEIVESVLMNNPEESRKLLIQLRREGFTLSIDDFGKGYSSLSYLSQMPVQIIKIDKDFIQKMESDLPSQHIVHSTIELAHKLGCTVVAEGVETEKTAELIHDCNCDYGQGFYFAKPLKDTDIIAWYKTNR